MKIWERSVISPNYGVASLISLKKDSVSVIYPNYYYGRVMGIEGWSRLILSIVMDCMVILQAFQKYRLEHINHNLSRLKRVVQI